MKGVTSGDICPDLGRVPVDTSSNDVHRRANPKENRDKGDSYAKDEATSQCIQQPLRAGRDRRGRSGYNRPETKKFKLGQPARTALLLILQILGDRS